MDERHQSGFEIVSSVLDRADVLGLARSVEDVTSRRSRAGKRHLMRHAAVSRTARDPRLLDIAGRFLGPDRVPFRATLFDKSIRNNWLIVWHQDTALPLRDRRDVPGWGPWSIKDGITYAHAPAAALSRVVALRLHIDDSRADNGPLRVIPGSHLHGVMSDEEIGGIVQSSSPVDCVVESGGVVAMRPLLLHASSKAESSCPRRVLHIEYADSLLLGDELELAVA